ncbi:MAG: transglutaminase-like domain-containing protein [Pirellula sp.]
MVETAGIQLSDPRKIEMQFGMRFFSNDNYCTNLHATIPFPLDWPEQSIKILNSEIPPQVRWSWRDLPGIAKQPALVRQLVMDIPALNPNDQLNLLVNVEVEKHFINPPPDTTLFSIPKTIPAEFNWFMKSSPYIDIEIGEIKRVAKQVATEEPKTAWEQVEKLYDWVRTNIQYRKGDLRQIKEALKDKHGDCEEMTGIFVALCRASKIPARCVWIPQHCYPEFYLVDPQGQGHWFPCQVAGDRQFGQMHDYRPILQKGDRFKVPEEQAVQRYVTTSFKCSQRPSRPGLNPSVEEVQDLGPLKAELAALEQAGPPPQIPDPNP